MCHTVTEGDDTIDEFDFLNEWCRVAGFPFKPVYCGSKYACYKMRGNDSSLSVIKIDSLYYVFPRLTALMFSRVLRVYELKKENIVPNENLLGL